MSVSNEEIWDTIDRLEKMSAVLIPALLLAWPSVLRVNFVIMLTKLKQVQSLELKRAL